MLTDICWLQSYEVHVHYYPHFTDRTMKNKRLNNFLNILPLLRGATHCPSGCTQGECRAPAQLGAVWGGDGVRFSSGVPQHTHTAMPSISLGLERGVVAHPLCPVKGSAYGSGRAEFQWRLWCFGATWSWQTPLPLETSLSSLECWDVDMVV